MRKLQGDQLYLGKKSDGLNVKSVIFFFFFFQRMYLHKYIALVIVGLYICAQKKKKNAFRQSAKVAKDTFRLDDGSEYILLKVFILLVQPKKNKKTNPSKWFWKHFGLI